MSDLFVPKILLEPVDDLYELMLKEATYRFEGRSITVPVGFRYNGASIPRAFYIAIGTPFHPRFMKAALPHDLCYKTHEQDKEWADRLFRAVLLHSGVKKYKADLMYQAVKDFGLSHWVLEPNGISING